MHRRVYNFVGALSMGMMLCISAAAAKPVYKDARQPVEARVADLLSRMTLEEKIGQLNQISGDYANTGYFSTILNQISAGQIGSILNINVPEGVNKLQKVAMEQTRLGIPVLMARDVIHGYKTIFPIPLGQAATFDPQIVEQGARVAAVEASSDGIRWTFSPMVDISRDPRWGRIAESAGEDVYLSQEMARAMVRGYQGTRLTDPTSVAACAKHFFGYGASEGGRDYNSTYIPERQMRNVYMPPFEAACQAGALTFMASFNDNDGIPASGNHHTLTDILRGEWGFKGFVVSDWNSVDEMVVHGFCADNKEAAMKGINAGVDMEMMSGSYLQYLPELIKEGKVPMATVDDAVANVLRVKFSLGLFENPYVVTPQKVKYCAEHLDAARRAAVESAILLKNDNNILPFGENIKTVVVTGPLADAPYEQMGTWTFDGEKGHTVTPLAALRSAYGSKVRIIYVPTLAYSRDTNTAEFDKAVEQARKADAVVAFVGEEAILSGEAHSLADLSLVGAQAALIDALSKAGKPLVTVVMAGRPLTIGKQVEQSSAVLYSFHPGTMGGVAIADLLMGKEVPSGKTPVTFPKTVGQVPIYYSHNNGGRPATRKETLMNGIPVEAGQTSLGCTSFWLDAGFDPLFPFGFGLSYGKFDYSGLSLDKAAYAAGDTIAATVTLTNSGKMAATEVVQLYVRDKVGSVTRPVKEIKAFRRVTLKPGESTEVNFSLPVSALAFYGIDMQRRVEPGDFTLWIGGDSNCSLSSDFKVNK